MTSSVIDLEKIHFGNLWTRNSTLFYQVYLYLDKKKSLDTIQFVNDSDKASASPVFFSKNNFHQKLLELLLFPTNYEKNFKKNNFFFKVPSVIVENAGKLKKIL
jgi:hypothetical protein